MIVAAAQIKVSDDKNKNLQKMLKYIKKAKGCDVICFPELSLQCELNEVYPVKNDLLKFSEAAVENNINIIFGSYIRFKEKIKNRIFVINNKGKIIHRYDKKHPYMTEENLIEKGKTNNIFSLNNVKCAVINCWDYAFPEDGRKLAKKGAKIIFCPTYLMSHPRTSAVLEKIPQVRAFDFMSYFVMVDAVAEETFKKTKICHPLRLLNSIDGVEGMIIEDLDLIKIEKLRTEFKNL